MARFNSVAMDERHLLAALRYVAMNPVKASLAAKAADWRWSSTAAHLAIRSDELIDPQPVQERVTDFAKFLEETPCAQLVHDLRSGHSIGRPLMPDDKLKELEPPPPRSLRQ